MRISSQNFSARAICKRLAITTAVVAAAGLSGCSKSHKDDPFQGTWFYSQATAKREFSHPFMRAIEFKDRKKDSGNILWTPFFDNEPAVQTEYRITGLNQITVKIPGEEKEVILLATVQDENTVFFSPAERSSDKVEMRWLKPGETLTAAVEEDRKAVEKREAEDRAKQQAIMEAARAKQQAEQAAALGKRQARIDAYADLLKKPGLILVDSNRNATGQFAGFALDIKPVVVANGNSPGGSGTGLKMTPFSGTLWVANDAGAATEPVTLTPMPGIEGGYRMTFGPPQDGKGVGAYAGGGELALKPAADTPMPVPLTPKVAEEMDAMQVRQLTADLYINGQQCVYVLGSDPAVHEQLIDRYKTTLAKVTRDQSIAWWFDYNHGRSRLSVEQRARVQSIAKQIQDKYGPENLLTRQQQQERANEYADLIAGVFTANQLADTPDCRAMQDYWEQAGYINGQLPADNNAMIDQTLQRTRDLSVFRVPAHKSDVPADAQQWLIGQRRSWARENADFEFVATSTVVAAASKDRNRRLILLAERAGVSPTGDRVLLYSDGSIAPLPPGEAQAALDAQATSAQP